MRIVAIHAMVCGSRYYDLAMSSYAGIVRSIIRDCESIDGPIESHRGRQPEGGRRQAQGGVFLWRHCGDLGDGKHVLVVDMDPQGHLCGDALGFAPDSLKHEMADVLTRDRQLEHVVVADFRRGLDVRSNIRLAEWADTLMNIRWLELVRSRKNLPGVRKAPGIGDVAGSIRSSRLPHTRCGETPSSSRIYSAFS